MSTVVAGQSRDLPPADSRTQIRLGMALLLLGLGGFFAWAGWAPLDEGVPVPGVVAVESHRSTVQHLTGGIVQQIQVREGDHVQAGQMLLMMDMTMQLGQRAMLVSQLAGLQAALKGLRSRLPQREKQLASLRLQSSQLEPLVEEELYARNSFAELQREISRVESELIAERASLEQGRAQAAELREKQQLLQTEIDRAAVTAPVTGTVFGLGVHTPGQVIAPGSRVLELVPDGDTLIVDAQLPTHLVEVVRAGLPARLRFIALNPRSTPVVDGTVALVGADRMTDEATRQSYYRVKVTVPADALSMLGGGEVTPGMPVEVIVVTGERTFLEYLLKPLRDRFANGLKER